MMGGLIPGTVRRVLYVEILFENDF